MSTSTPRTIHYFWDGVSIPTAMTDRLERWSRMNSDWSIRRWTSADSVHDRCPYAVKAHQKKQWAYLSDYARILALYEHGGVYIDTDVELLKPFDVLADGALHVGYMHNCALGTAVIISPPRHPIIADLLLFYERLEGDRMINNNAVFTEYFLKKVPGFKLDGRSWNGLNIAVHKKTFFEQPSLSGYGYSFHLYSRSWANGQISPKSLSIFKTSVLFSSKRMVRSLVEESRCFYLRYYLRDRYRLPVRVPELSLTFDHCRAIL